MDGRILGRRVVGFVASVVVAVGCTPGSERTSAPPPETGQTGDLATPRLIAEIAPSSTGPTDDLAPSQLSTETAPPPEVPPPCDPTTVTIWTAQVVVVDDRADAVLRVRNDGDVRCEVDVGGSPLVDPLMEPDVWLDPGGWADLVVGPGDDDCADAATVGLVQLDVNGEQAVVETAAVVPCGWRLTAFYPNELSDLPCDRITGVVVDGAVLVRNEGPSACLLGELVDVEGVGAVLSRRDGDVAVPMLAGGDVVAIPIEPGGGGLDTRTVELVFDTGATVVVDVDAGTVFADGAPQPWIGGPGSPSANGPTELLVALDPFGDDA